jgi:hypothetical protein
MELPKASAKRSFGTSTETEARILQLRRQHKLAVSNVDFDRAEELDREIAACRNSERASATALLFSQFRDRTVSIVEGSRAYVAQLVNKKEDSDRAVRIQINSLFQSLQDSHFKSLADFERDSAQARLRETERTIPEQEKLLLEARHAGAAHLYDRARELRDLADLIGQTDLEARLVRLEDDCEATRQALLKKQRSEIEALSRRLDAELKNIDDRTRVAITKEWDLRDIKLVGHFDKAIRDFANIAQGTDSLAQGTAFEREFATHLTELNCPIPRGIGNAAKTRPQTKKLSARIR